MTYESYQARHEAKKQPTNKKLPLSVIALLLIFTLLVGGTVAFLATRTENVENTFVPGEVKCEVLENATASSKSDVKIKNTGNVQAYLRAAVVVNWVKADGSSICGAGHAPIALPGLGTDWSQGTDGFYYYMKPVAPGESTATALFSDPITLTTDSNDGCKLQVEIVASAIQAEGTGATSAMNAWSQTPGSGN